MTVNSPVHKYKSNFKDCSDACFGTPSYVCLSVRPQEKFKFFKRLFYNRSFCEKLHRLSFQIGRMFRFRISDSGTPHFFTFCYVFTFRKNFFCGKLQWSGPSWRPDVPRLPMRILFTTLIWLCIYSWPWHRSQDKLFLKLLNSNTTSKYLYCYWKKSTQSRTSDFGWNLPGDRPLPNCKENVSLPVQSPKSAQHLTLVNSEWMDIFLAPKSGRETHPLLQNRLYSV